MTSTILSQSDLAAMVADLVGAGTRVIAPASAGDDGSRTEYRPIGSIDEAALGGGLPRRSLKEFFLPPTEVLLRYRQKKGDVELQEVPTKFPPQVILGARPCDAAGVETLDKVMGWDFRDELWFGRREATTIVTLACPGIDSTCFCGALGLGPDAVRGADALLIPLDGAAAPSPTRTQKALQDAVDAFLQDAQPFSGAADVQGALDPHRPSPRSTVRYVARSISPKGDALLRGRGSPLSDPADRERAAAFVRAARSRLSSSLEPFQLPVPLDRATEARLGISAADGGELIPAEAQALLGAPASGVARLPDWLAAHFDHPVWSTLALRCHGCGACTAVCSTCHCFDIVDEHDTYGRGARRRNWDFCQSAKFTLHASGHNPRQDQNQRLRQRIMHKFSIYPRRFDTVLCTGCGRCARACGAGMNLPEVLGQLVQLAAKESEGSAR